MNILFVSSGNSSKGLSLIVENQGRSLNEIGLNVDYFLVEGKGPSGYMKNIEKLRKKVYSSNYDVIHAHYSLSGYLVSIARLRHPIVVSLMGSDVMAKVIYTYLIGMFYNYSWDATIVKSNSLAQKLNLNNVDIIPNGVDFSIFKPINKSEALEKVGWDKNKKHLLFAANPNRLEKNFALAKESFGNLNRDDVELHSMININHDMIPYYMNASEVVILTSLWEGSPNVIKEAMACSRPIVSTDVGDVCSVIGDTEGCFISSYDSGEFSQKISFALNFEKTNGRLNIGYLDKSCIAQKILNVYKRVKNEG